MQPGGAVPTPLPLQSGAQATQIQPVELQYNHII